MDKTTDISDKEKITLIIQHFKKKEEFFSLVHAQDLTSHSLAQLFFRRIKDWIWPIVGTCF